MKIPHRHTTQFALGVVIIAGSMAAAVYAGLQHELTPESRQSQLAQASTLGNVSAPQAAAISEKPKLDTVRTTIETTEEPVPFDTTTTYDGTLPKDTIVVRVDGADGKKLVKTQVKSKDGVVISRELISEEITVPPVTKIVAIGTKFVPVKPQPQGNNCSPDYTPCIKNNGGDLGCKDIGTQVHVLTIGQDPYGLDRDDDGIGCDDYPPVPGQ